MTEKKPTHLVDHPGYYFRVDGKLQAQKKGTPLTLGKKEGAAIAKRGFVVAVSDKAPVDLTEEQEKPTAGGPKAAGTPPPPPAK